MTTYLSAKPGKNHAVITRQYTYCHFCRYFMFLLFLSIRLLQIAKSKIIQYKSDAHYWQTLHGKAVRRESNLKKENEDLKAKLKLREQQLFGKKSEQSKSQSESTNKKKSKRSRGHQKGAPGHIRTNHDHLPCEYENIDIRAELKQCPCCGLPYQELPQTEDSTVIEIVDVKAHRRVIRRKMYKRRCACDQYPQIITAPSVPKLIPKSKLGVTLWVKILIEKYKAQIPFHRILSMLNA